MIHEIDLLQCLASGRCTPNDVVSCAATKLQGQVSPDDRISKVQKIFDDNNVAMVIDNGEIIGIVSKIDVIEFMAARS